MPHIVDAPRTAIAGDRGKAIPLPRARSAPFKKQGSLSRFLRAALAGTSALALVFAIPGPVEAAQWTGNVNSDWMEKGNWNPSTNLPSGTDDVYINNVTPKLQPVLGVASAASGQANNLTIGQNSVGTLTVQNGSTLTVSASIFISRSNAGSAGSVLTIDNATVKNAGQFEVGVGTGMSGEVMVTNGGKLETGTAGGNIYAFIGNLNDSKGKVTVTGANSQWTSTPIIFVGRNGTSHGELNIENSGTVTANGGVQLTNENGATGKLSVTGTTAAGPGILETTTLKRGPSNVANGVQVNFNNGMIRALADNVALISGFKSGEITTGAGGITIDTNGKNVSIDSEISGTGGIVKTGAGTLTMKTATSGDNGIGVNEGTLLYGASSSFNSTSGNATINVARGSGQTATLTIKDGATVKTAGVLRVAGTDDTSNGTVNVDGATLEFTANNYPILVGWFGTGTLNISNGGKVTTTGTNGYTLIGRETGSTGNLNISGGGTLTTAGNGFLGGEDTSSAQVSTGNATILGAGSEWSVGRTLYVGNFGTGNLTIGGTGTDAGGKVTAGVAILGSNSGSDGTAKIEGAGSSFTAGASGTGTGTTSLIVGQVGKGEIDVTTGGLLTTNGDTSVGGNTAGQNGTGTVTITGATSQWSNTGEVRVGQTGTGHLNIGTQTAAGGTVTAKKVVVGNTQSSKGTLTVQNGGTLAVESLARGSSNQTNGVSVTFDGGTLKATGATTTISGFTGTELNIGTGGMTIDSNGNAVDASAVLSGAGALTKTGAGTLTLSAANTFAGGLNVQGGSVTAGVSGALGKGPLAITNPGTVEVTANTEQKVGGLIGNGGLAIEAGSPDGGKMIVDFAKDAANTVDTYSGKITTTGTPGTIAGAGIFEKQGDGTLLLSGDNSGFKGTMHVINGVLQAGSATAFGSILEVDTGEADLNGYSMTLSQLYGSGGIVNVNTGAGGSKPTLTVNYTDTATDDLYQGNIEGDGSLRKQGAGTLVLSGNNTFTGGLHIEAGQVTAGSSTAFGAGVLTVDSGTADLNGQSVTVAGLSGTGGAVDLGTDPTATPPPSAQLTLNVASGESYTYSGNVTGGTATTKGYIVKKGAGSQTLSGTNSFIGGVTVDEGTLFAGSTSAFGDPTNALTLDGGTVDLNGHDIKLGSLQNDSGAAGGALNLGTNKLTLTQLTDTSFDGKIAGSGTFDKEGGGTLTLTGDSSAFTGITDIGDGKLQVDGTLGGTVNVNGTSTLQGMGRIDGSVNVNDQGTLSSRLDPSFLAHKLTITKDLTVANTGTLLYTYAANPANDTDALGIDVGGNISLGTSTIKVTTDLGAVIDTWGVYRLIEYDASIAGQDVKNVNFDFSTLPDPSFYVGQSGAAAGEVNFIYTRGMQLDYWDPDSSTQGIQGGAGLWTADPGTSLTNWTDPTGTTNARYQDSTAAIFQEQGGVVTVDTSSDAAHPIKVAGMQFTTDGYIIGAAKDQGTLTLIADTQGQTRIAVGENNGGQVYTATINSKLAGNTTLLKDNLGTLVLAGTNTYTGGTLIDDGVLEISSDQNLGADAAGNLNTRITLDGQPNEVATLRNTGAIVTIRPVTLSDKGGTFDTRAALTLNGKIEGAGALTKTGTGTLTLKNPGNSYSGGTFINEGTVSISNNGDLGNAGGGITFNGGTLENTAEIVTGRNVTVGAGGGTLQTDANLTLTGLISGSSTPAGPLKKTGGGKLTLTADSTYAGTFTIQAGELDFGNGGAGGSIKGDIVDDGVLNFNRSDKFAYGGKISGSGTVNQIGAGETTLTGENSYTGTTSVSKGTLIVNGNQTAAKGDTNVTNGATLRGGGIIGGNVNIGPNSNLTAEDESGTGISALTINGNLSLDPASNLNYNYGLDPNANQDALMIKVKGNLNLNGTLNVTNTSGTPFDVGGIYGLLSYGGNLTGNGLTKGTLPGNASDYEILIANGRVSLYYNAGQVGEFWSVGGKTTTNAPAGGTGLWQGPGGTENWTNLKGQITDDYVQGGKPIFMGTAGTVTVDSRTFGAIQVIGMQFVTPNYIVKGATANDAITLLPGRTPITVGDYSGDAVYDSVNTLATLEVTLAGAGQLAKAGNGTLILKGNNTYTGGTNIESGTLQISSDANLGAKDTALELSGGTLQNTAEITTSNRKVTLGNGGGTFQTDQKLTLTGPIDGAASLTKTGAAELILSGASTYSGATNLNQGTLAAGAANAFSANSAFNVGQGTTLALRGFSQEVGSLANSGTVDMAGAEPGAVLTVKGNYTGQDGSGITLSTKLEGDNSKTDRLVVGGSTSGNTTLTVKNAGGGGAQTDHGILLVDVEGASNGNFTLNGDYTFEGEQAIVAGAYAYRLYKGGPDWFLRSKLLESDEPQFQAGVPVYEAYAGVLQAFNYIDSLQNRLGNRNWTIEAQGADGLSEEVAPEMGGAKQNIGVWASIDASDHRYRPETSTSRTAYDVAVWRAETGIDGQLYENAMGRLIGGASMFYGTYNADTSSPHGDGKIDGTGYGIGGTLTWYGNNGIYVDAQARTTWYDSDLKSDLDARGTPSSNDGNGYGLSIEAGKRIPIQPDWFITPQAQLAWSRVKFDGFSDGFDAVVTQKDGDSLLARMGLSVDHERQWQDASGQTRRLHGYGLANIYYDFDSRYTVDVASTPFVTKTEPLWAGLGLGGSYNWANDRYSLYGEALARTTVEDFADNYVITGNIGLRVRW